METKGEAVTEMTLEDPTPASGARGTRPTAGRMSRFHRGRAVELHWLLVAGGAGITLLFGYLAVRHVDLGAAWRAFTESNEWWLGPALLVLAFGVFLRALRWRYLFSPATRPPIGATLWAYLVGQLFNNILPLRAGEAARILALRRRAGTSAAEAAATIFIERVYDVLALLFILFVLVPWFPRVSWLHAGAVTAIVLTVGLGVLALTLALFGDAPLRLFLTPLQLLPAFTAAEVAELARNVTRGLASALNGAAAILAMLLTVLSWITLGISCWLVSLAFDLPRSPLLGILVVIATNLAQILPSAPAAVGVFEAATLVALTAYGVPRAVALSYAVLLHVVNFLPYLVVGPFALRWSGVAALRPRTQRT